MVRRYRANGVDYLAHADQHAAGGLDPVAGGGGGGGGYATVQDEGVGLTVRTILNFKGTGVTAADNAGTGATDVTIPGGGGTPAASVVAETGYGQGTIVGVATNYAREDHSHGSPALGATGTTAAAGNHTHTANPALATNAIVLGAAAAAGVATTTLRSDDTIAAFDATAPVTQAFGDAAAVGTIAFAARRDHRHGMPANPAPAFATPAIVLGTAAAAGAAATVIRSDATIVAFDATAPANVAAAAAVGAAAVAARRDHAHTVGAGIVTRAMEAADGKGWAFLGTATGATTTVGPVVWTGTFRQLMIVYFIAGYSGNAVGRLLLGAASISTTALNNGSTLSEGVTAPTSAPNIPGIPLAVTVSNIARGGVVFVDGASGQLKSLIVEGWNGNLSVSTPPSLFRGVGAFSDLSTNLPLQRAQLTVYDTLTAVAASSATFASGTYLAVWGRNTD